MVTARNRSELPDVVDLITDFNRPSTPEVRLPRPGTRLHDMLGGDLGQPVYKLCPELERKTGCRGKRPRDSYQVSDIVSINRASSARCARWKRAQTFAVGCMCNGDRGNGSEAAITSVDGSSSGFRVITTETVSGDFGWNPDGRSILFAKGGKLLSYDVETRQTQQLPGQPLDQPNGGAVWDSTGERIVFQSTPKPQSIPW